MSTVARGAVTLHPSYGQCWHASHASAVHDRVQLKRYGLLSVASELLQLARLQTSPSVFGLYLSATYDWRSAAKVVVEFALEASVDNWIRLTAD